MKLPVALFVESALSLDGEASLATVMAWIERRRASDYLRVERWPISDLAGWRVSPETGDISHTSGRFFAVRGVDYSVDPPSGPDWRQPIIVQEEIGILGFLVQRRCGVLHFLVQAKVEPGNVNGIQLSPTVQATESNYTRVHGGRPTAFLDYFLGHPRGNTVVDCLGAEQASRFFRKRNRNMVVEIAADEVVSVPDNFQWVTLGQLLALMRVDNLVNMDSQSIIGSIPLVDRGDLGSLVGAGPMGAFYERALRSMGVGANDVRDPSSELRRWFDKERRRLIVESRLVPLGDVDGWHSDGVTVSHSSGRYFRVLGVAVEGVGREVSSWHQPLVESVDGGVIGLVTQMRDGCLQILIRARRAPGTLDHVELAPTIQFAPKNYDHSGVCPPFWELFASPEPGTVRYEQTQSEEGGRFYRDCNRHMIVEIPDTEDLAPPQGYCWWTVGQVRMAVVETEVVSMELRTLLAALLVHPSVGQGAQGMSRG